MLHCHTVSQLCVNKLLCKTKHEFSSCGITLMEQVQCSVQRLVSLAVIMFGADVKLAWRNRCVCLGRESGLLLLCVGQGFDAVQLAASRCRHVSLYCWQQCSSTGLVWRHGLCVLQTTGSHRPVILRTGTKPTVWHYIRVCRRRYADSLPLLINTVVLLGFTRPNPKLRLLVLCLLCMKLDGFCALFIFIF